MPKGKRKGKSDRGRGFEGSFQTSDDDSVNDNLSVISNYSGSIDEGTEGADEFAQEQFEEKLVEVLDGLTQKSAQGRTNSIQSLCKALVKKYVPNFVRERHFTICDSVEKSLRKGGSQEKSAAAELASLLCVQLGEEDSSEMIDKPLRAILISTACDKSVPASARAKCCLALGIIGFVAGNELADNLLVMQHLESVFCGSYLKGDGSVPTVTTEMANMHTAAISAWTLLLSNMPGSIFDLMDSKNLPTLEKLSGLLESAHLDVRLAVGEALALIFEEGRRENINFANDIAFDISETIKTLATDGHKYRAKKERKQQRATFRDILKFIEDDIVPDVQVKFGREVLVIDTWARRIQYDELCNILGPGINLHLTENQFLRDVFEISAPVDDLTPTHAQHQVERYRKRLINAANYKARTLSRAKNRDKRADF